MTILRVGQVLAVAAIVVTLAAAASRPWSPPLWIAVLLLALLACLKALPL
jgi:hypothetical protein